MEMDEAIGKGVVFLEYFRDLPDPRQAGKVVYPLDGILLLCLLAVLAGAETFTDIARFGAKKLGLSRRFRPFRDGAPAHDHLGDIFAIENSPHWVMDMIFRDDECRARTDHAPANVTTIKHRALNLLRKAPGRDSLRLRRKVAAWDNDFLASLIAA